MSKIDRHTTEYRKQLANVKPVMEKYLSKQTGYFCSLGITKDANFGYCYRASVSLNKDMDIFASYVLKSPCQKSKLRDELKEYVLHIDWKSKKNGQTTVITKRTKSSSLSLECAECRNELAVVNFHRHLNGTECFKERHGYSYICKSCLNENFIRVFAAAGAYTGAYWVCAVLDRPFYKEVVEMAIEKAEKPIDICNIYLRLINLQQYRGKCFADSDIQF